MVTEKLLIRECSCFSESEKVNRDDSLLEYIHSLIDMVYLSGSSDVYSIDIDFYYLDSADRFERLINNYGILMVGSNKMVRFCDCAFRLDFTCGSLNLFTNVR